MTAPLWETAVAAFADREDRKYYSIETENPTIATDFEGGYTATRPRFNRSPLRRTITTGFTDLSPANKQALENFWNQQKGGAVSFYWMNKFEREAAAYAAGVPVSSISSASYRTLVRFDPKQTLKFTPKGAGQNLRYDIASITFKEV